MLQDLQDRLNAANRHQRAASHAMGLYAVFSTYFSSYAYYNCLASATGEFPGNATARRTGHSTPLEAVMAQRIDWVSCIGLGTA